MRGIDDFNGDGKNDLLWHNQSTGSLYVWFLGGTNGVVQQSTAFLTPGAVANTQWQVAEVADFNADGKSDVLWHHQASGSLYVWYLGGANGIVQQSADFLNPSSIANTSWKVAPR